MQKWEHKLLILERLALGKDWQWRDTGRVHKDQTQDQRLKEMGLEGWELVNVAPYSDEGYTVRFYLYFKRNYYSPLKQSAMNKTIKTGLAVILVLAVSCTKENIHGSTADSTASIDKAVNFSIRQRYGGALFFILTAPASMA